MLFKLFLSLFTKSFQISLEACLLRRRVAQVSGQEQCETQDQSEPSIPQEIVLVY